MKRSKPLAVLALGAALSMALAACGGSSSNNNSGGGTSAFGDGITKVANPSTKTGGTLKFVHSDDLDSYDPGNMYYAAAWDFSRLYARPLTTFASKPGKDGTEVVPDLAEGLGVPSDGGKTWTYKLKQGIKYEDGAPVTAKDVKYAVARSNYTTELEKGPKYFLQYLINPNKYKGPYKDKNLDDFKGVTTPDDSTVVFHLNQAFYEFDRLVTIPESAPVPAAKDTKTDYLKHPVSTGPYKFESDAQPGKSLALVKNSNWDASNDPNRKQLPDRVEVQFKVDANEIDNRLFNGTANIDLSGTGVQAAARSQIVSTPAKKQWSDNPYSGFLRYAGIDMKVAPFDKLECRQAVEYAADRVALQTSYGGSYGGDIATTVQTPQLAGSYQKFDLYPAGADNHGDVAKAKAALQACGKPSGFATNVGYRSDRPKELQAAQALQQSLAKVGIQLTLKGYPSGTYTSDQAGTPDFVHKNNLGLMIYGWGPDFPSGFGFFQQIVDGRAIKPSGNSNISELNDPKVNADLDKAAGSKDEAVRNQLYADIDKQVMTQAAILPFIYEKPLLYRNEHTTNVYVLQPYGMYDYANMGVK
ncbi:MAG: extracellular solute-binding protein family 5 [Actinoallomurus sp.]|nr:extracellular solute-binding protein family 5 [Actinoallomurus sp.]